MNKTLLNRSKILSLSVVTLSLATLLGLSACGKIGKPEQPGPSSKITYPHSYPME